MSTSLVRSYISKLHGILDAHDWRDVDHLGRSLRRCWKQRQNVFLCGNGGSAANAVHLANDFLYGIDKPVGHGLRVTALAANTAVLTCLANDLAYQDVFAQQLMVLADKGDILIALSGSGNSPNILEALKAAKRLGVTSYAILGYSGGKALRLADHAIHFPIDDMQIAEDLQMIVGHMLMKWLHANRPKGHS